MSSNKPDVPLSKAELKRAMVLEHNRKFDEEKANPKDPRDDLTKAMVSTVMGFRKGLGL